MREIQHCYVTGGSQGLGLAVAERLTKMGAHVSIVARDEAKLATALASLEVRVVCARIHSLHYHRNSYNDFVGEPSEP